jgi:hypothetical protein
MKRNLIILSAMIALFCFMAGVACAAEPVIKPTTVVVSAEKSENKIGTFKGLKVKTRDADDDFFSFNFFISLDDLTILAKKCGKTVKYDAKAKKLEIGKATLEVIPVKVTKEMNVLMGKISKVDYKGKPYFDLWNTSSGLGYDGISKMNDGVLFSAPVKTK